MRAIILEKFGGPDSLVTPLRAFLQWPETFLSS
jgi:hypothetical protein